MRLLGRTGQLAGRTVAVTGSLRIGRAPENELQLSVDGVSRTHAQVTVDGDTFWLEDLSSANGTYLNGVRVTKERLAHLDVITIGRIADLIVDARAVAAPAIGPVTGQVVLEAIDGPEEGSKIPIPAGEVTIGRVAPSTILIDSRVVSKLHARVRRTNDRLALDDLDSPNGTFVNGARVTTNCVLNDGDTISIAGVRSFRVRWTGSAATPPPIPVAAVPAVPAEAPAAFNQEWKTKLVWSADELSAVEAERARVIAEVRKATGSLPGEVSGPTEVPAASSTAVPAAPKTQFMGRDSLPIPPEFRPATAAFTPQEAAAPSVPPARSAPAAPAAAPPVPTTAFRPGADLPPSFMDAPPPEIDAAPIAPVFVAPPSHAPAPAAPPSVAAPSVAPASPNPSTSFFRPGADLPPTFADAPPTAPVAIPAAPPLLGLRGAAGDFTLAEGQHIVGRQEGVSVFISDRQVSRHHAVITVQQGRVTIEDKASANGTFVNGARLSAPRVLSVGDQVKFGDLLLTVVAKN